MYSSRGFTLWEVVIVIAIMAVIARLTVPGLAALTQQRRSDVVATQLDSTLRFARFEAFRLNKTVALCPVDRWRGAYNCAATSKDWSKGVLVFIDVDNNGKYDSGELLKITRFESSFLSTATVSAASMRYAVNPDSTISPTTNNYICFKLIQKINRTDYTSYAMFNSYGNMIYCKSPANVQTSECAPCR